MHVKHVRTNAKVGADLELGPKTIIVGPNGSGKSTVINAVELALTGRVSDLAGRVDVGREADVMALAPAGEHLFAEVTFDDGKHASYIVEGSTAKAKKAVVDRPVYAGHEEVLPIRTLREALLGSPATARKFLLAKVAGDVTRDDVAALFPTEEIRQAWQQAVAQVPSTVAAPDTLVMVLERAAKAQRDATADAKAQREAAKLVGGGRAAPPSKAEIQKATKIRDEARAVWQQVSAAQGTADRRAKLAADLATSTQQAEAAVTAAAMAAGQAANAAAVEPPSPIFPHVCAVLKESLTAGACLACGNEDTAQMPEALAYVEESLRTYQQASAQQAKLDAEAKSAQYRADSLIDRVERLEEELARLDGETSAPASVSVEEAKAHLDRAEQQLTDLRVVADAWASAQKAEAAAQEAEKDAERWKALKSACEEAVGIVLAQALSAFIARVQEQLPDGDVFDLRLQDGDREVVQFGLVRHGHLHTALSGAEWARVIAAMAGACVPADRLAVLIPEERAFDAETLAGVLDAFSSSPHQVILASPIKPKRVPKGWTLVVRGGAS